jgi:hypothetical protein
MHMRNIALVAVAALLSPPCISAQDSGDAAKAIADETLALKEAYALPVVILHTTSPKDSTDVSDAEESALSRECLAESPNGELVGPKIVIVDGKKAHGFQLCRRADMQGEDLYELLSAKDAYMFRTEQAKTHAKAALADKCRAMGPEARLVGKSFVILDGFAANAVQACRFKKPG